MSYEYCITRGVGFHEPFEPIALDAFRDAVRAVPSAALHPAPYGEGAAARIGASPRDVAFFEAGRVVVASPSEEALLVFHALGDALGARVFGEDEPPLTLATLDAYLAPEPEVLAAWREAALDEPTQRALLALVDGPTPPDAREAALAQLTGLADDARSRTATRALAVWLATWVRDTTKLGPVVLDALLALVPPHLDRADGVAAYLDDALDDRLRAAVRHEPFVVRCPCTRANRLPSFPPRGRRARCGACKAELVLWGNPRR